MLHSPKKWILLIIWCRCIFVPLDLEYSHPVKAATRARFLFASSPKELSKLFVKERESWIRYNFSYGEFIKSF